MAKELELSRKLSQTAIDRKDSELTSLSMALQQQIEENSILKSELRKIGGSDDRALAANLQKIISQWQKQSKQTRDWTKANQLISELKNLIG